MYQGAMKSISHLDPRPGMQVGRHETQYVIPEVIVEFDEDTREYTARLRDGSLPSLRLNAEYSQMIKQKGVAPETKEFLQNSARSARWLIESIQPLSSNDVAVHASGSSPTVGM